VNQVPSSTKAGESESPSIKTPKNASKKAEKEKPKTKKSETKKVKEVVQITPLQESQPIPMKTGLKFYFRTTYKWILIVT